MLKMKMIRFALLIIFSGPLLSMGQTYTKGYFRNPLNIPMQLVGNFGELRTNHWHMGLDIRTQQRENLPVYAAAAGYISRVKIEPGGFGRAIYIAHPNGFTTLYAHLNAFTPALDSWIKQQQYQLESWAVDLELPQQLFPVTKGQFIAYSGNTGGSAGPHVHFEIRDTETGKCVNPLLFGFPVPDAVAPSVTRLAMYDRNRSTYLQQPQLLALKKSGNQYSLAQSGLIRTGSNRVSFALSSVDRFSGSSNPNGIMSASVSLDGKTISGFYHDNLGYEETRYMNAQVDYRYYATKKAYLQHISPLPGDQGGAYRYEGDGVVELNDTEIHDIRIEVRDANGNLSLVTFKIQYDPGIKYAPSQANGNKWAPGLLNIFEEESFEAFSTPYSLYDTAMVSYSASGAATGGALTPVHHFMSSSIPVHDEITVRLKPQLAPTDPDKVIIKNVSGTRTVVQKAVMTKGWASAKFRQFGTYQAFADLQPPTINAPATNLSRSTRIVFTPRDNFNTIKSFRAELNGKWLRFTNDKGRSWIYYFDEHFPRGTHELKVVVEDVAGNVTTRTWTVTR